MIESKYTIKDKGVEITISDYSGERTYNITDRYYITSFYTHENEHIDDLREIKHMFIQLGKHGCYLCAENLITDRYTEKEWKRLSGLSGMMRKNMTVTAILNMMRMKKYRDAGQCATAR